MKWSFVPKDSPKTKFVVCNADESEPGSFKDRYLLELDPHSVIEGMIIAAYALGSSTGYVYFRGEYNYLIHTMDAALAEAREAGMLGKNILGSGFDHEILRTRVQVLYLRREYACHSLVASAASGLQPPFPAVEALRFATVD